MDDNGDKRISKEELKTGLQDYGISLNLREIDDVFTWFDRDRNGFIDVTEFLVACKGDLNERRKKCVKMAFDSLDADGSGEVTVDEMMQAYGNVNLLINYSVHCVCVHGPFSVKFFFL